MKNNPLRRMIPALLATASLPLLSGCNLFRDSNDHVLFVEYDKVGISTSGAATGTYEPLVNLGWTGGRLAIAPAPDQGTEMVPLFVMFKGDVNRDGASVGNIFATGEAAVNASGNIVVAQANVPKGTDPSVVRALMEGKTKEPAFDPAALAQAQADIQRLSNENRPLSQEDKAKLKSVRSELSALLKNYLNRETRKGRIFSEIKEDELFKNITDARLQAAKLAEADSKSKTPTKPLKPQTTPAAGPNPTVITPAPETNPTQETKPDRPAGR